MAFFIPLILNKFFKKPSHEITNGDVIVHQQSFVALLTDLGGTNCRVQLVKFNREGEFEQQLKLHYYKVSDFQSYEETLEDFFNKKEPILENIKVEIGVMGGPGVADEKNVLRGVNLPESWTIYGNLIEQKYKLKKFIILNDNELISYGLLTLDKSDYRQINDVQKQKNKPMLVVGPGTGLGVSALYPAPYDDNYRYYVWPGEGGHALYSPMTQLQREYEEYVCKKNNFQFLWIEKALTGANILTQFEFLRLKNNNQTQIEQEIPLQNINPKDVFDYAKQNKCPICKQTLDFFLELLATEVSNMALRTLCYSGVYIVGTISDSITQYALENKDKFLSIYLNRNQILVNLLKQIPIYFVKDVDLGLKGAIVIARRHLI